MLRNRELGTLRLEVQEPKTGDVEPYGPPKWVTDVPKQPHLLCTVGRPLALTSWLILHHSPSIPIPRVLETLNKVRSNLQSRTNMKNSLV